MERRRRTQARWRSANPDYDRDRRMRLRAAVAAESVDPPDLPRVPEELACLPWSLAQSELGVLGTDFVASLGSLVLRCAQDQRGSQVLDSS